MKDIKEKSTADLVTFITEKRAEIQKFRFGTAGSSMRNTHAIRNTRKVVAQALTELTLRNTKKEA